MQHEVVGQTLKFSIRKGDVLRIDGKEHEYAGEDRVGERQLTATEAEQAAAGKLDVHFLVVNTLAKEELDKIQQRLDAKRSSA